MEKYSYSLNAKQSNSVVSTVLIDGYLLMHEKWPVSRWSKKWLYIVNKILFIKETSQDKNLLMSIPCDSIYLVQKVEEKGNHIFAFEIWTLKNKIRLCADSEKELKRWMDALGSTLVCFHNFF